MWNGAILIFGIGIPFFLGASEWWHWLAWPAGLWIALGGIGNVVSTRWAHYKMLQEKQSQKSENISADNEPRLTTQQLDRAKAYGQKYAELDAMRNLSTLVRQMEKSECSKPDTSND